MQPEVKELVDTYGDRPTDPTLLDPALRPFYEGGPMPMLRHPLVYQVPFFSWKIANDQYRHKTTESQRRLAARDWSSFIAFHERPYRLPQIAGLYNDRRITTREMNRLLAEYWTDTEFPHRMQLTALTLFRAAGFVTDEVGRLPPVEEVVIYRGQRDGDPLGMSWTTSLDRAKWFARRWGGDQAVVCRVMIPADLILGTFNGRDEDEVVVDPKDVVRYEVKQSAPDDISY